MTNKSKIVDEILIDDTIHVYLSIIGGKWKPEILWHLRKKSLRFLELQRSIPRITQSVLTQNLRELEADGLLTRTAYPEIPPRVEYELTVLGKTAFPVLDAISVWGREYMKQKEGQD
ncbi:helix-turn-helix domain-containing protein [uncultured Methanospirillum sp.]|uniref:winged helix-turn-helix transcriptional regulator n=1 Tax=uncultured Methanospirillum sp. TaxID=262503 RepID=UPI0029C954F4|nr:helix-turn-helix domain-containing protein [uncultured Methanospirillum sp.]